MARFAQQCRESGNGSQLLSSFWAVSSALKAKGGERYFQIADNTDKRATWESFAFKHSRTCGRRHRMVATSLSGQAAPATTDSTPIKFRCVRLDDIQDSGASVAVPKLWYSGSARGGLQGFQRCLQDIGWVDSDQPVRALLDGDRAFRILT